MYLSVCCVSSSLEREPRQHRDFIFLSTFSQFLGKCLAHSESLLDDTVNLQRMDHVPGSKLEVFDKIIHPQRMIIAIFQMGHQIREEAEFKSGSSQCQRHPLSITVPWEWPGIRSQSSRSTSEYTGHSHVRKHS